MICNLPSKEITLIEIPYWWDRKINSLASTIFKNRSDVISQPLHQFNPIPDTPSAARAARDSQIRNMFTEPQEVFVDDLKINPTGWYVNFLTF